MRQGTISITFDAEKLSAVKRYMGKKDSDLEEELTSQLLRLYEKYVPAGVREYIEESAAEEAQAATSVRKPQREVPV